MTIIVRCVKPAKERNERSLLQDGKQGDDKVMTTNRQPLIKMWSKTAPKGTKRAKVASITDDGAATHHGKLERENESG